MRGGVSRAFSAAAVLVGLTLGVETAAAQSLGEVARKEAERRQQVQSGRVYTNADLLAADPPASPAPSPPPAPQAAGDGGEKSTPAAEKETEGAGPQAPAGLLLKPRETRPEEYWRMNARALRADLAKAERDVEQAETRLKELEAAPQTPAVARERAMITKALAEFQQTARYRRGAIGRFEAFAESQKVPPDWIR